MATIYVVTSGSYSDYGINGVFDSKEKAQTYIDFNSRPGLGYHEEFSIEEWELNSYLDNMARGLRCFYVEFKHIDSGDATIREVLATEAAGRVSTDYTGRIWYWTYVWAADETAALKIANERRVQAVIARETGQS